MNYTKLKKEFEQEQQEKKEKKENDEYLEAMKEIGIEINPNESYH